ncbi:hypothetical protein [Bradyrhizobium sp. 21]|uniref:hypothetical protein n=1 Tax=Bradyrhizobium sp. 21 TaxID=2782666 RepID=UPI001FF794CC|nr:hypothetical protein [Bradyrhizobium sp. 21]
MPCPHDWEIGALNLVSRPIINGPAISSARGYVRDDVLPRLNGRRLLPLSARLPPQSEERLSCPLAEEGIAGIPAARASESYIRERLLRLSRVSLRSPIGSTGSGGTALAWSRQNQATSDRTLLNAIAGLIPVHSGTISFRGEDIAGERAFAIVRKGLALSPEGWRLFVQQCVENNLMLGATPLHDRSRRVTLLERVYESFRG